MVVGHDHAFGRNREGNAESLREYGAEKGFTFTQVGPLTVDGGPVSSTRIRLALQNGNVDDASRWLGRRYSIRGTVVEGAGRGQTIGYPTANLAPHHPDQLVPGTGVYAVRVVLEGDFEGRIVHGMANIGRRPTFEEDGKQLIEAHLFNWNDELYHRSLTLEFCTFLRSERKFDSKESLVQQLDKDRQASLDFFASANHV
jgi:riboflavin kinase/FMN adenylyltransferase